MSTPTFLQRLFRPFTTGTARFGSEGGGNGPINVPEGTQLCTLAAGCFWGVEHMYRHKFQGKGVIDARVGYIGGDTDNPSYRAVCSGATGRMFSILCFASFLEPS